VRARPRGIEDLLQHRLSSSSFFIHRHASSFVAVAGQAPAAVWSWLGKHGVSFWQVARVTSTPIQTFPVFPASA
jgi:hypothetical protein